MAHYQTRQANALDKLDPVWTRVRQEGEDIARREPELASFIYENILHHDTLETAVAHRVSQRLEHADVSSDLIRQAYREALEDQPSLGEAFRADIVATLDRDPDSSPGELAAGERTQGFCTLFAKPLLRRVSVRHQSGSAHRPRHFPRSCHWPGGRRDCGDRGRCVDPAWRHARWYRQGARRSSSENPSWCDDRCRRQEVGHCARIAAGSVVVKPVPNNVTVAGVPAKVVGEAGCPEPSRAMDQMLYGIMLDG
jgi:serine O-acetyltransferase